MRVRRKLVDLRLHTGYYSDSEEECKQSITYHASKALHIVQIGRRMPCKALHIMRAELYTSYK